MKIRINSIKYNSSLVDGPGIRTVLYMQGCDLHCPGCHNKSTWNINEGIEEDIDHLVNELYEKVFNKKITISGGEPLYQKEALAVLISQLKDKGFNIVLYTGHRREDVPQEIVNNINYLKTGNFIEEQKTTVTPFVGSTNQKFEKVK